MPEPRLFTSESVTEGQPDKVADQISDAVLDALLDGDQTSRVAVETLVTTGMVFLAGDIATTNYVDIPAVVRQKIADIGYTDAEYGFDAKSCAVIDAFGPQAADAVLGANWELDVHRPVDVGRPDYNEHVGATSG